MTLFIEKGKLVSQDIWRKKIQKLESDSDWSKTSILNILKSIINTIPDDSAVMFSGGIDSTFIAYLMKLAEKKFTCYSCGLEGAKDLISAKNVAKELGFRHHEILISQKDAEDAIIKTVKILGIPDAVNIGVGSLEYALLSRIKEKVFVTGLGSEEIFAGYHRHKESIDINEECWSGLIMMWQRDLIREVKISTYLEKTAVVPFLEPEIITEAMKIPGDLKIKDGITKHILRKIAIDSGIPETIAMRPKKAMQYGSLMDKALLKLARRNGFKYRKDYLVNLCDNK